MLVVFTTTHLYITKTTRWEVVKNSASPKRPFFCDFVSFFPFSEHFHSKSYISTFFLTHTYLFHFFSLQPHPPLIQNGGGGGGHTLHAYSFSYWGTPTSGPKGGGMCLKKCPPPPRFTRSAHNYSRIHVCKQNQNYSSSTHRGQEY